MKKLTGGSGSFAMLFSVYDLFSSLFLLLLFCRVFYRSSIKARSSHRRG
jgi:hypothetical protein